MKIGTRLIGEGQSCFVIAEAGVNHNGQIELAEKLVDIAADAGADAVKFQTYKTSELILPDIEKAPYQKRTTNESEGQRQMLESLEIDEAFHRRVIRRCEEKGILFLSTPYDAPSLDLLIGLNVPAVKIASTDATNLLFLQRVARSGKPVILSTGMTTLGEIEKAVDCLRANGCTNLALLKCTSDYPTAPSEVNLSAMIRLARYYDGVVGFSDHTRGVGASPYAVAMGAHIVEKHFTADQSLPGPDHQASLSPEELSLWIKSVREVETYLGNSRIGPTESEKVNRRSLQKNLVARVDIASGTVIEASHLAAKRTGGRGISAIHCFDIVGSKAVQNIEINTPLFWKDLEAES